MGVPFAVLSDSEPPLLSERCRVRIRCVRWVPVSDLLTREVGLGFGVVDFSGSFIRRRRRGKVLRLIRFLVMITHIVGAQSLFLCALLKSEVK